MTVGSGAPRAVDISRVLIRGSLRALIIFAAGVMNDEFYTLRLGNVPLSLSLMISKTRRFFCQLHSHTEKE